MTPQNILSRLETLCNAKVFAHNKKSGASDNQFGVKLGDIRKIAAQIKTNHKLALELWATGNVDARLVAILVMKPDELSAAQLEKLVKSVDFTQEADWLTANIVKQHPDKETLRQKWLQAKDRWLARAGWSLTAERINKSAAGLDLAALLARIEKEMPSAPPEVQWTMNFCLAGIGIHHPGHRTRALAIGEALGIYRDFPCSKGCTSPFAPIWINEMVGRQKSQ
jgi:3-methyladenine DNA glycosylase AlkD